MKPDLYTKAILTVIALLLAVMVAKPYIDKPEPVAKTGPTPFAGVQAFTGGCNLSLFDPRSGTVSWYNMCPPGSNLKGNFTAEAIRTITLPGKP